jgi:hypothetical protein
MLFLSEEIGTTPRTIEIEEYTREVIKKHRILFHSHTQRIDTKVYFFSKTGACLGMIIFQGSLPRCLFELLYLSSRTEHVVTTSEIAYVVLLSHEVSADSIKEHVYVYRFPEDTSMSEFILKDMQYLSGEMYGKIGHLSAQG